MKASSYDHRKEFRSESHVRGLFRGREFEECLFAECDFSYADFADAIFTGCRFERCTFALTGMGNAVLREVVFSGCNLTGLEFGDCSSFAFGVEFRDSGLDNCSFARRKMAGTKFTGCKLRECYFGDCDLSGAVFRDCSLPLTGFDHCDLRKADFRTAEDWIIDPRGNSVTGARFSSDNLRGLVAALGVKIE